VFVQETSATRNEGDHRGGGWSVGRPPGAGGKIQVGWRGTRPAWLEEGQARRRRRGRRAAGFMDGDSLGTRLFHKLSISACTERKKMAARRNGSGRRDFRRLDGENSSRQQASTTAREAGHRGVRDETAGWRGSTKTWSPRTGTHSPARFCPTGGAAPQSLESRGRKSGHWAKRDSTIFFYRTLGGGGAAKGGSGGRLLSARTCWGVVDPLVERWDDSRRPPEFRPPAKPRTRPSRCC